MVEAGLPDDLDSQLRSVCNDVVASMGRSASFGFLPSDPDFDTMTERVCERLFAEAPSATGPSPAGMRANSKGRKVVQLSKDRKVCPVVKSAMLGQKMYQLPAPQHEHCASVSSSFARTRAPLAQSGTIGTAGYDSRPVNQMLVGTFQDQAVYEARFGGGVDGLKKPNMSSATLKMAGYDEKTSGAIDSLTNLLSKQPKLPQFPPTWMLAQHAEMSKQPGYSKAKSDTDYDEEARKLWARLNIDPTKDSAGRFNSMDAVFCHPETKATLYVGNEVAAKNLPGLEEKKITHIVNCTDSIPNHHEDSTVKGSPLTYLRFDIVSHRNFATQHQTLEFVEPMLTFVGDALGRGENVMVHCLAGAHRAGTTGIICLMHFAKLTAKEGIFMAKQCRPIIDPIGDFPALLARLERGWAQPSLQPATTAAPVAGAVAGAAKAAPAAAAAAS